MDKETAVTKRDMKSAKKGVNDKVSPWWPLQMFLKLNLVAVWMMCRAVSQAVKCLFRKKKSIKGKIVLITGAGRGLGRAVGLEMARLGAHIACVDINTKNNEETARIIKNEGGTAEAFSCNVAMVDQVEALKRDVTSKMGHVDILINNAALVMAMGLKEMTYKDIRAMYEVNCMGPVFLAKAFLSDMVERNSGHLVTISSVAAMSSVPFLSLYCSTKSGLSRFFDSVRVELNGSDGNKIKVTTVHPFFINTSADYVSWFESFFPILEESAVVNSVVEATLYEKENVSVPGPLGVLKLTDALMGSYQYNAAMTMLGDCIHLPSQQEREKMPYTTIVSEISSKTG